RRPASCRCRSAKGSASTRRAQSPASQAPAAGLARRTRPRTTREPPDGTARADRKAAAGSPHDLIMKTGGRIVVRLPVHERSLDGISDATLGKSYFELFAKLIFVVVVRFPCCSAAGGSTLHVLPLCLADHRAVQLA